jgi:MFS family permease
LQVLAQVLGTRDFWLLAGWFFFNGGVLFSFAGLWAGPYYMQAYAMSKTQAGQVINVFAFGWVFGPLIFAWIAGRVASRGTVLGGSIVGWAFILVWMLLRNGTMSLPEIYVSSLIFGFLGAGPAGVCFAAVKERFPLEISGAVTGFTYMFPMIGSAVYQPLAGAILDHSGKLSTGLSAAEFTPLFWFYLASIVAGGVLAYAYRTQKH